MADESIEKPEGQEKPPETVDLTPEIEKYAEQLAKDPKSRVFALLAEAYRKSGRFNDAIEVAEAGLNNHPHYLSGRVALARAYYDSGNQDMAVTEFEKVIATAPDNLLALRHLSDIYISQGRMADAAKILKMVVLLDPNDAEAREKLQSLTIPGGTISATSAEGESLIVEGHRYEEAASETMAAEAPEPEPPPVMELPAQEGEIELPEESAPVEELVGEAFFEIGEEPQVAEENLTGQESEQKEEPFVIEHKPPATEIDYRPEEGKSEEEALLEDIVNGGQTAGGPDGDFGIEALWEGMGEPEGAPPAVETKEELDTETMADIHVQQGSYDKALAIYEKLLSGQPENSVYRQKCEELRNLIEISGKKEALPLSEPEAGPTLSPGESETIDTLKQWLANLKKERDKGQE